MAASQRSIIWSVIGITAGSIRLLFEMTDHRHCRRDLATIWRAPDCEYRCRPLIYRGMPSVNRTVDLDGPSDNRSDSHRKVRRRKRSLTWGPSRKPRAHVSFNFSTRRFDADLENLRHVACAVARPARGPTSNEERECDEERVNVSIRLPPSVRLSDYALIRPLGAVSSHATGRTFQESIAPFGSGEIHERVPLLTEKSHAPRQAPSRGRSGSAGLSFRVADRTGNPSKVPSPVLRRRFPGGSTMNQSKASNCERLPGR
jgi:hypothetical protein